MIKRGMKYTVIWVGVIAVTMLLTKVDAYEMLGAKVGSESVETVSSVKKNGKYTEHSFADMAEENIRVGSKVSVSGNVRGWDVQEFTLIDGENGGLYRIKNSGVEESFQEGDSLNVWGDYLGNEEESGLPIVYAHGVRNYTN